MYAPTQEKVDALSPQRKRILSMVPEDRWADPKEVAQSLSRVEGVHLSMTEVMKVCHSLAKMGFMQIRETSRESLLKKLPVKGKQESTKPRIKPMIHEKVVPIAVEDVLDEIEALESEFLNFAERVTTTMTKAAAEIKALRQGDSKEVARLKGVEEKYNKLRELLK